MKMPSVVRCFNENDWILKPSRISKAKIIKLKIIDNCFLLVAIIYEEMKARTLKDSVLKL